MILPPTTRNVEGEIGKKKRLRTSLFINRNQHNELRELRDVRLIYLG